MCICVFSCVHACKLHSLRGGVCTLPLHPLTVDAEVGQPGQGEQPGAEVALRPRDRVQVQHGEPLEARQRGQRLLGHQRVVVHQLQAGEGEGLRTWGGRGHMRTGGGALPPQSVWYRLSWLSVN